MKTSYNNSCRLFGGVIRFVCVTLILSSCEQQLEPTAIQRSGARSGAITNVPSCPTGQHYDYELQRCVNDIDDSGGGVDCSVFYESNLIVAQRDRVQSMYGSNGTHNFDELRQNLSTSGSASTQYIYNYSPSLRTYITRLESAAVDAQNAYIQNNQDGNYLDYNTDSFRAEILAHLNIVKADADNDGSLNSDERGIVNSSVQAVMMNFYYISSLIESSLENSERNAVCFPNPPWYNSTNYAPEMMTQGFFRSFLNVVAKTINIITTIVVNVIEQAAYGAVYGAIVGTLFPVAGTVTGFAVGAVIGGVLGIAKGVNECIAGNYICVFSPCS